MLKDIAIDQVTISKLIRLMSTKTTIGKVFFVDIPDLSFETYTWSQPDAVLTEDFTSWDEIYGRLG